MMYQKKYRILAMLLVLVLVLAGCGRKNKPQAGEVAPLTQPETQVTLPPETTVPETTVPETTVPETTVPETTEVETTAASEEENPLSLGRMEGGVYTNAYAGFGCELDEGWTFYGAEELQELPETVKEAIEGSELAEQMDNYQQITDMMAENSQYMVNVNVLYSKQDLASRLATQAMTEEQLVDATLEQKDQMMEAYAQMGLENITMEKTTVTFLGETHWAIKTVGEIQGATCYIAQVFNFKAGAFGVTLSAASFVEDNTQAVLDLFYAVN